MIYYTILILDIKQYAIKQYASQSRGRAEQ